MHIALLLIMVAAALAFFKIAGWAMIAFVAAVLLWALAQWGHNVVGDWARMANDWVKALWEKVTA